MYIPTVGIRFQDVIVAALKDKFGPPMSTETATKQNAFGAKFQVATMNWKISGVRILFDGGDLDHGTLLLSTDKSQFLSRAAARQKF